MSKAGRKFISIPRCGACRISAQAPRAWECGNGRYLPQTGFRLSHRLIHQLPAAGTSALHDFLRIRATGAANEFAATHPQPPHHELSHPWFLLGAAAIAGPILFHLIRYRLRERMPFSSLSRSCVRRPSASPVASKLEDLWLHAAALPLPRTPWQAGFARPFLPIMLCRLRQQRRAASSSC